MEGKLLTRREMKKEYGTPEEFEKACNEAVPGEISVDEANLAIEKYKKEWAAAK